MGLDAADEGRDFRQQIRQPAFGGQLIGQPLPLDVGLGNEEELAVAADVFCDGHDLLRAVVRYRPPGSDEWGESELRRIDAHLGGVRWAGTFAVDAIGRWEFTIEAWTDVFATWRDELARKVRPVLGARLQQVFGMAEGLLNYTRLDDPDDVVCGTDRAAGPGDRAYLVERGSETKRELEALAADYVRVARTAATSQLGTHR